MGAHQDTQGPEGDVKKPTDLDGSARELALTEEAVLEELALWSPLEPLKRTLDAWARAPLVFGGLVAVQSLASLVPLLGVLLVPLLSLVVEASARSLTGSPRFRGRDLPERLGYGILAPLYVGGCALAWTLIAMPVLLVVMSLSQTAFGGFVWARFLVLGTLPLAFFLRGYAALFLALPATYLFGTREAYLNAFELVKRRPWQRLLFALPFLFWMGLVLVATSWIPSALVGNLLFFTSLDLFLGVWTFRYLQELEGWRQEQEGGASFPSRADYLDLLVGQERLSLLPHPEGGSG